MQHNDWGRVARAFVSWLACVLAVSTITGCARFNTEKGVANTWRAHDVPAFERGTTTEAQVLEVLGPPSQIIALHDGSAYYYLKEQGAGKAMILLLYNTTDYKVSYDRAVFFFDKNGVLREYAYSKDDEPTQRKGVNH